MIQEVIWGAGFFDGEGWSGLDRGLFRMALSQKDERPLRRFHAAVGFGTITKPKKNGMRQWRVSGPCAKIVAERLRPWLSAPKREQMDAALEAEAPRQRIHACRKGFEHIEPTVEP